MTTTTIQQAIKSYQKGPTPAMGNGEWVINPTYGETRRLLGKSFAGTKTSPGEPVFDWTCNHLVEGNWYTEEEHLRTVLFGLGLACFEAFKRNPLVVARRDNSGGEFACAAVLHSYDSKWESSFWRNVTGTWWAGIAMCKLMLQESLPEVVARREHKRDLKHFENKWTAAISAMDTYHNKYGPQEDHWYIKMVGVGPQNHGKGYGRELMEKIHSLADESGVPACYLECGASNQTFYKRMGYSEATKLVIEDPVDSSREPCIIFVMVRMRPVPSS
jgi:N-acetylglutamate synthase-like GNAT family acetyltransferase